MSHLISCKSLLEVCKVYWLTDCDFYELYSMFAMLQHDTEQSDAEPKSVCVFVSLQGHFEAFAKTLITLLKMETMSRMLQSTYYVCNRCACITVRSNWNGSLGYENFTFAPFHSPQEQYEPPASSPSSVWDCCSSEVCV